MKSEEPTPTADMVKRTRAVAAGILLFSAASALTVGGHAPGVQADPTFDFMRLWRKARAAEAYRLAHPELASEGVVPRRGFVGPPIPAKIVVARAAAAQRRGGIGPLFGPEAFAGAMNTTVSLQGVVRGPNYRGAPLPNTGGVVALPGEYLSPNPEIAPEIDGSDLSSEIPDLRSVALSRLANPDTSTGANVSASKQSTTAATTAPQGQLRLQLHAVRPRGGFRAGENVAIRLSASASSYAAVIRVDAAGNASVAFRSPGPSTTFGCVIKTGPSAGSEYYVAVASVKPLNGADVAAALRSVGMTYSSTAPSPEGGVQPAAAWNSAVQLAAGAFSGAPSGAARWQRTEYAVTGVSVAVRAPQAVATAKKAAPAPAKTASTTSAPKPATPAPSESVVPTEAPKPAPEPAESEPPKENSQTTPTTPNINGAKWDLPPTTRRKPGARPNGATLELLPVDVREALPSVASVAGPTAAIVPES